MFDYGALIGRASMSVNRNRISAIALKGHKDHTFDFIRDPVISIYALLTWLRMANFMILANRESYRNLRALFLIPSLSFGSEVAKHVDGKIFRRFLPMESLR